MIKAKKAKLLLNIIPFAAVAAISATTAIIVYSSVNKNESNKAYIASRAINSNLIADAINTNLNNSSNKDNNLEKLEKVKETVVEAEPVEKTPEAEPAPAPEPEPTPEPEPAPVPEPTPTPTPEPEPAPQPAPAPKPEPIPEPEPEPKKPIIIADKPVEEKPAVEIPPVEKVEEPPLVLEPKEEPKPQPQPEPAPAPEPQPEPKPAPEPVPEPKPVPKATEGAAVKIESLPDLDFAKLKSPKNGGSISEAEKAVIKNSLNTLKALSVNIPAQWTAEQREQLHNAYEKLYKYEFGGEDVPPYNKEWVDNYFTLIQNDGKTMEEKLKALGLVGPRIVPNQNPALDFKNAIELFSKELDERLANGWVPHVGFETYSFGVSWAYADPSKNVVRNHAIESNKKRYFGYDKSPHRREDNDIKNNNYPGWVKTDVTSNYSDLGVSKSDGIEVLQYNPESEYARTTEAGKSPRFVAVLDAANPSGYSKFLNFIKELGRTPFRKLDGIVIKNMGKYDRTQKFDHILSQIPDTVKKLTLIFEARDTSSLRALKDKHIEELEIYTSNGALDKEWAINPYALRGVKFVSFDYAQQGYGTIVFNKLKFDAEDNLSTINEAFRMVFDTRSGERIFQGAFGDGSWPTKLDFSNVPAIRSLKGMFLNNRVFKELTLYNSTNVFEVDLATLTSQQWSALLIKGPERPKLYFSSPTLVNTLYFKGDSVPDNFGRDLYGLIESGNYHFQTIYVDNQAVADTLNSSQAFRTFNKHAVVKPANFNANGGNSEISFD
ncbi:putative immunoglobulin-blocking virulence protein [Mycoplasmopsis columboralis]|uniref:putative immunoglobulin-blocking virulence protein n=1 Tax=Mycoplasmopsis columboralis TaxID=171282 RepID=UPI00056D3C8A|nr:putative immunoglobulin-blocking virulence protein [Mycoplasmopsis columboralis]